MTQRRGNNWPGQRAEMFVLRRGFDPVTDQFVSESVAEFVIDEDGAVLDCLNDLVLEG